MSKPFTSLNSLLRLMRKRNISIKKGTEGSKVKNILSRENYYSVINGYKDIFLDQTITESSGDDYYISGTTFFQIYEVYCFDRELRHLLLRYLLQAEKNLATKLAYHFSDKNKAEFSHLNINNFSKSDLHTTTRLISILSTVTQKNSKFQDSGFYHYLTKHQSLPLWVLVTKLTFGELTYFYKSMLPVLQEKVLGNILDDYHSEFGFEVSLPTSTLINNFNDMLDTLVSYRNICAHGDRLYNHRVRKGKHTRKLLFFHLTTPKGSETSLWGLILTLRLFLPYHDYKCMIQNMISSLATLSKAIPQQQFNSLLNKIGLTLQWKDSLLSLI
ncbi:Abi family protein [Veillonella sp. 3627]|uniref:Abi family protein n=1 Tax=Veillonella sp. 3627 TaxID=2490953 RepID=UPI000F8ED538|nr:Abi family protein [Veillonella sp. 3627]